MAFMREQFTFYRSFVRAAEQLPAKQRAEFLAAIIYYALDEKEPEKLSNSTRATFEVVRPILDKARRKAQSGKTGGEASGKTQKQIEANTKQNESKTKQTGSTGMSPVITETVTDTVTDTVTGADIIASPDGEKHEAFTSVFERLRSCEVVMVDKEDCDRLCAEYGTRAVIEAIDLAKEKNVNRWPYIRAIVTSGGVQKSKAEKLHEQYHHHGEPLSPLQIEAALRMLEGEGEQKEADEAEGAAHGMLLPEPPEKGGADDV